MASIRRKVFLIGGEYSANLTSLTTDRRAVESPRDFHAYPEQELGSLFFRAPHPDDHRAAPLLQDLLASAGHRALCALHELLGLDHRLYEASRHRVTHLIASSMPGLDPTEQLNIGLIPQVLRGVLGLSFRCKCQFQVGTSDSGAWAFAEAVRIARSADAPATVLITAGQIIPSGYVGQYHIRSVLGKHDQSAGLDMLAAGDLWMDVIRRSYGVSRRDIQLLLQKVSERKFKAALDYPAALLSGQHSTRKAQLTPYFDRTDIAPPCCGAAAAIVTSDEGLVEQVARSSTDRYRSPPVVEVLGVGEGSSNPDLLDRQSPLVFAPAIRQAFAAAADDALVPTSVFSASAFAVIHDAFPSIELSFLLSLGLDWDSATYRMQQYWPNPFGGLLTFGHALGASGLVQVVKALHTFTGDRRYVRTEATASGKGGEPPHGFPDEGSFAFTTSVGGPLSHIVITLLRGGRATPTRTLRSATAPVGAASEAEAWHGRRQHLRRSMQAYLRRLRAELRRSPGGEACLVEGLSRVNLRSCLRELREDDLAALSLEGLEHLFKPDKLQKVRSDLLETVRGILEIWRQSDVGARLLSYDTALGARVHDWAVEGALQEDLSDVERRRGKPAKAQAEKELVGRVTGTLKERLGMPFIVIARAANEGIRREVHFLPLVSAGEANDGASMLGAAELDETEIVLLHGGERVHEDSYARLPADRSKEVLPWWTSRAVRPAGAQHVGRPCSAEELLELLHGDAWERDAEVEFLRTYFSPFIPHVATELAMQGAGVRATAPHAQSEQVPVALYWNEIIAKPGGVDWRTACELNGEAVNQARGWLGMYMTNAVQTSGSVQLVSFDERLRRGADAWCEAIVSAARFARDVALWSLRHGVHLRAVISVGVDGLRFHDVNRNITATTAAEARARALLEHVKATYEQGSAGERSLPPDAIWICFDLSHVGVAEITSAITQRLPSWQLLGQQPLQMQSGAAGEAIQFAVWSYPPRELGWKR